VGFVVFETDVLPVPEGRLSNMYDGTVNCPAAVGERHRYVALAPEPTFTEVPLMLT
jgi:hypothetical protein